MDETFHRFDATRDGYAAFAAPTPGERFPDNPAADPWRALTVAVHEAEAGRFSLLSEVARLTCGSASLAWDHVCCQVLGDAADADTLEAYVPVIEENRHSEYVIMAARALFRAGRLADVPLLFHAFEQNLDVPDASILAAWIDALLGRGAELPLPSEAGSFEDYRRAVTHRYHTLCDRLGSDQVYVYGGEVWDVVRHAEHMLDNLRPEVFRADWRHRFEASTGIDCRGFYRDGRFQPLSAAAILEEFLASTPRGRWATGERYFFGHPLDPATALERVLSRYEPNAGLGAPAGRAALARDEGFVMEFGFAWRGGGYFDAPPAPLLAEFPREPEKKPWLSLAIALREAKRGDRSPLARMAALLKPDADSMFTLACAELLADAADKPTIDQMRRALAAGAPADLTFALCSALLRRGHLCDVPLVLDVYAAHFEDEDFRYLQTQLNQLFVFWPIVSPDLSPRFPSFTACRRAVEERYAELSDKIGRDDLPIFRNDVFSVQAVAQAIIDMRHGPFFAEDLRYRFEASTGIDCTAFFTRGELNRDVAAATARDFLASPDAVKFEKGKLYFFGHPLQSE